MSFSDVYTGLLAIYSTDRNRRYSVLQQSNLIQNSLHQLSNDIWFRNNNYTLQEAPKITSA